MDFHLSASDRRLIESSDRDVFLAIIRTSGEITVRVADERDYPGHKEWIARDHIPNDNVVGGFSFIVKEGLITGFFPSSQMNRTPDWRLTESELEALFSLLPLATDFRVF